jgi:purine-binding chemotaxis protein CheW
MTASASAKDWPTVSAASSQILSFTIDRQVFGLSLQAVHDVLDQRPLTRIPLAPPAIAGALNLRGRIITAIESAPPPGIDVADLRGAAHEHRRSSR